jgi:hypothetical protein
MLRLARVGGDVRVAARAAPLCLPVEFLLLLLLLVAGMTYFGDSTAAIVNLPALVTSDAGFSLSRGLLTTT